MLQRSRTVIRLAFLTVLARAAAADPRALNFDTIVGPDGPWNALVQSVSWPERNVTLLPALTRSNLLVSAAACSGQGSACPLPQTNLWSGILGDWSWMNSTPFDASSWDTSLQPLNLTGQATTISDRVTLHNDGQSNAYLDFTANTVDQSVTVNFPSSDTWYTMDTGFLSLYGGDPHLDYTSQNGSAVSLNTTLPAAYSAGAIPSIAYGLHVGSGSVSAPVAGSLILGGYDKSRCLTSPIISTTGSFILTDISLGVAEGRSPFSNAQNPSVKGLLRQNGNAVDQLTAYPNPGVPYLHLPADTCSAIAANLPVSFNANLGLYLWNTSDPAYTEIITSPSYLSFTFQSHTSKQSTTYVPFALLNLTLDYPLAKTPTQYLPCSPYQPSDSSYHLGRAFLQAAFLAQNWQTGYTMLAQAPGPDFADQSIVTIAGNDTTVSAMFNAPLWNATWASKLKALEAKPSGSRKSGGKASSHNLSTGAIVGIVIGVLVLLAVIIAVAWLWRRKTRRIRHDNGTVDSGHGPVAEPSSADCSVPVEVWASGKHVTTNSPVEMHGACIGELDGGAVYCEKA